MGDVLDGVTQTVRIVIRRINAPATEAQRLWKITQIYVRYI